MTVTAVTSAKQFHDIVSRVLSPKLPSPQCAGKR